jgi:hypothetical protein
MVDFNPEESFNVYLKPYEYQELIVTNPKKGNTLRGLFYIDSDGDHKMILSIQQEKSLFNIVNKRMHIFSHNDT